MTQKYGQSREVWKDLRKSLEYQNVRRRPLREKTTRNIDLFGMVIGIVKFILFKTKIFHLIPNNYSKIIKKNNFITTNKNTRLKILHISDLHMDENSELFEQTRDLILQETYDLCFVTGDIGTSFRLEKIAADSFLKLTKNLKTKHGIFCVLGNHDSHQLVDYIEKENIHFLTNQYIDLVINNQNVRIIGTDDVHYFFSEEAIECLKNTNNQSLNIALVHSPEMYDFAANSGVDLYFCGHTHGGQIRIPGLRLITRCTRGKQFYRENWQYKQMKGYTNSGIGASGLPLRIFTNPEVVIHHVE